MNRRNRKNNKNKPEPLEPSYPGQDRRYGGNRRYWRNRFFRHPYFRYPYFRYPEYRRRYYQQPVYVVKEVPRESHWWYPSTWYHSLFYEGFQNERNMNCGMLLVLCLIILVSYFSKTR